VHGGWHQNFGSRFASQCVDQSDNATSYPAHDDGLDFELTDFDEARRILDSESMSQFDVATVVPPEHWKKLRRGNLPTDRALTGQALDWLLGLPPALRPENLTSQFPRITNALAEVWDEPLLFAAALEQLLCDRRKDRKGFAGAVRGELVALRNWTQFLVTARSERHCGCRSETAYGHCPGRLILSQSFDRTPR